MVDRTHLAVVRNTLAMARGNLATGKCPRFRPVSYANTVSFPQQCLYTYLAPVAFSIAEW
jgi:hypothetical protein